VPAGFFVEDYDEGKLGLLREQVELLAVIRDWGDHRRPVQDHVRAGRRGPHGDR
jgi:hypothetical protein